MGTDSLAEPGSPIPDRVPDDLVRRYGAEARRTVRRPPRRRRTFALTPRLRRAVHARASRRVATGFGGDAGRGGLRPGRLSARLGTGEVWITALIVFGCSIIGVGLIGAVVYAVALYPWIGITVLFTLATLLTFSYWAALRLVRREHARRDLESTV